MPHLRAFRVRSVAIASVIVLLGAMLASLAGVATSDRASAYGSDSTVFVWGYAPFLGSPGTNPLGQLVGIAATPDGQGYWIARADGAVYRYGSAVFYGNAYATHGAAPVIGIAATPTGHGYWLVAADGGVFSFGDAQFYGSAFGLLAGSRVTGIASTASGRGYWVLASNGGVFTFGDARFFGSAFGLLAGSAPTSIVPTRTGQGYWVTAGNGGIFTFGDASFFGSAWGATRGPIVSAARTSTGNGYYLLDAAGDLFRFGDAHGCTAVTPAVTFLRQAVAVYTTPAVNACWVLVDNVPASGVIAGPGNSGALVSSIQSSLLARGFWLSPTGSFDALTQQAVYAFQKAAGLARTGVVSANDWRVLQSFARPKPRSTTAAVVEVDLARQLLIFGANGTATWIFNTSTGSGQPYSYGGASYVAITPTGHFTIIRQIDGLDISHLGTLWRPKFFTWDGVAIHGSPSIPPYPASHGCVRVSNAAIDYMWAQNLLPIGAQVWVY